MGTRSARSITAKARVRPGKRYAARRSGRRETRPTIIVNVPPFPQPIVALPEQQQPVTQAKATLLARTWSIARVVGPSVVAVTALVISLLAYADQHAATQDQSQVDKAQITASNELYAEHVFYLVRDSAGSNLEVTLINTSSSPIFGVRLAAELTGFYPNGNNYSFPLTYYIGTAPPCSRSNVVADMAVAADVAMRNPNDPALKYKMPHRSDLFFITQGVYFTDRNGLDWSYGGQPTPRLRPGDYFSWGPKLYPNLPVRFEPTRGCS